jgi:hypothetical protein
VEYCVEGTAMAALDRECENSMEVSQSMLSSFLEMLRQKIVAQSQGEFIKLKSNL